MRPKGAPPSRVINALQANSSGDVNPPVVHANAAQGFSGPARVAYGSYLHQELSLVSLIAGNFVAVGAVKNFEPVHTKFLPDNAFHGACDPIFSHIEFQRISQIDPDGSIVNGSTGLKIHYEIAGKVLHSVTYSWTKIYHYIELSKAEPALRGLSRLWSVIRDQLSLPYNVVRDVGAMRAGAFMNGLRSLASLRDLTCFFDEDYAWDDVVNALLEIMYLQLAARSPFRQSPWLLMNTHITAFVLRSEESPLIDQAFIRDLKKRLANGLVKGFILMNVQSLHFNAIVYTKETGLLARFDSLSHSTHNEAQVVRAIAQFVRDVPGCIEPTRLDSLSDVRQPPNSGSCGFIALNFVSRYLGISHTTWVQTQAGAFRLALLAKLLLWAVVANRHPTVSDQSSLICTLELTFWL